MPEDDIYMPDRRYARYRPEIHMVITMDMVVSVVTLLIFAFLRYRYRISSIVGILVPSILISVSAASYYLTYTTGPIPILNDLLYISFYIFAGIVVLHLLEVIYREDITHEVISEAPIFGRFDERVYSFLSRMRRI